MFTFRFYIELSTKATTKKRKVEDTDATDQKNKKQKTSTNAKSPSEASSSKSPKPTKANTTKTNTKKSSTSQTTKANNATKTNNTNASDGISSSESEEEFRIERIKDWKWKVIIFITFFSFIANPIPNQDNRIKFLVCWEGYGDEDDTYEYENDLMDNDYHELVDNYRVRYLLFPFVI